MNPSSPTSHHNINNNTSILDQSCDTLLSSLSLYSNYNLSSLASSSDSKSSATTSSKHHGKNSQNSNASTHDKLTSELTTTVLLPPIEMSAEEQRALGYMPLRDDFERVYKNDAETLLSNLTIANNQIVFLNKSIANLGLSLKDSNGSLATSASSSSLAAALNQPGVSSSASLEPDNDDAIDYYLKLSLIHMYRECLIERQRFKKIAREYGLINNATALINNHNKVLNSNGYNVNNYLNINSYYNGFSSLNSNGANGCSSNNANSLNTSCSIVNANLSLNNLLVNGNLGDNRKRRRNQNDKEMMYVFLACFVLVLVKKNFKIFWLVFALIKINQLF